MPAPVPFTMVIFGGTGDLALRKLLPALANSDAGGALGPGNIVAVSRRPWDGPAYVEHVLDSCDTFGTRYEPTFLERLDHVRVDATSGEGFDALKQRLADDDVRVFYLATAPELFASIAMSLRQHGLVHARTRIVLEKPLGRDLASSRSLSESIEAQVPPDFLYRIDHYLGKESVLNLMALRFGNSVFEPLWNRTHIDHVQITVAETVGIEGRAGYYDHHGALRDMVQNHMLQLLCLIAMEPPVDDSAASIQTQKEQVLRSLRPLTSADVEQKVVRARYEAGQRDGTALNSYEADGGDADRATESFVAIEAAIDNLRWADVPFFLRTGKRLHDRLSEVVIQFRPPPHWPLTVASGEKQPNRLVIRLQPDDEILLMVQTKVPGRSGFHLRQLPLDLVFAQVDNDGPAPDAYERLLLDVIDGNRTLFMGREEVELAWAWVDRIQEAWASSDRPPLTYPAGGWGPQASHDLIGAWDGAAWGYGQGASD
jgi:glucose-6-phosphate 1-dehydrogenase